MKYHKACLFCIDYKECNRFLDCEKIITLNKVPNALSEMVDLISFVFDIISTNIDNSGCNWWCNGKQIIPYSAGVSEILSAGQNTLLSLLLVINNGSFADTFTLLRKLLDDILLSLYILKSHNESDDKGSNYLVDNFIKGELIDKDGNLKFRQFNSQFFLEDLLKDNQLRICYEKFFSFEKANINRFLNNNVHTNGLKFIKNNLFYLDSSAFFDKHSDNEVILFSDITRILKYITNIFLSFVTLLVPNSIQSSDYFDFLECGEKPPENSQYWVAPCINEYLNKHMDKELVKYLNDENRYGMHIIMG